MFPVLEKFHVHVDGYFCPFVIWAENPLQAVSGCRMFDDYNLVDVIPFNKFVFSCTMAESYAVRPCDLRRVTVYKVV